MTSAAKLTDIEIRKLANLFVARTATAATFDSLLGALQADLKWKLQAPEAPTVKDKYNMLLRELNDWGKVDQDHEKRDQLKHHVDHRCQVTFGQIGFLCLDSHLFLRPLRLNVLKPAHQVFTRDADFEQQA